MVIGLYLYIKYLLLLIYSIVYEDNMIAFNFKLKYFKLLLNLAFSFTCFFFFYRYFSKTLHGYNNMFIKFV
jgi:hypothetical protein